MASRQYRLLTGTHYVKGDVVIHTATPGSNRPAGSDTFWSDEDLLRLNHPGRPEGPRFQLLSGPSDKLTGDPRGGNVR